MSGTIDIPASTRYAETEATSPWVCGHVLPSSESLLNSNRFMADKIMPLSEAVEGYDIFDKMKAQKGMAKNSTTGFFFLY